MNNEQPEALRLADILQHKLPSIEYLERSAAELRRLHELHILYQDKVKRLEDIMAGIKD